MGSAQLAFCARADNLFPGDIHSIICDKRTLVKTSAMRQTLHLLPAAEYRTYIAALRQSRMRALMHIMARIEVGQKEIDGTMAALMKILGDAPIPQRELAEQVKPRISKELQGQLKLFWNNWPLFRPAIIEGLICYGPDRGREATFVRAESWLPKTSVPEEQQAKDFLLRRFLRAYGPATVRDFSKWSGMPIREAKPIWDAIQEDLTEVSIEGTRAFVLSQDLRDLEKGKLKSPMVRLLPAFDPYMLAHEEKDHLVDALHYKRVYRNQGWLSAVVLVDGRVAGIWSYKKEGPRFQSELFQRLPAKILAKIDEEAERMARFAAGKVSLES